MKESLFRKLVQIFNVLIISIDFKLWKRRSNFTLYILTRFSTIREEPTKSLSPNLHSRGQKVLIKEKILKGPLKVKVYKKIFCQDVSIEIPVLFNFYLRLVIFSSNLVTIYKSTLEGVKEVYYFGILRFEPLVLYCLLVRFLMSTQKVTRTQRTQPHSPPPTPLRLSLFLSLSLLSLVTLFHTLSWDDWRFVVSSPRLWETRVLEECKNF